MYINKIKEKYYFMPKHKKLYQQFMKKILNFNMILPKNMIIEPCIVYINNNKKIIKIVFSY